MIKEIVKSPFTLEMKHNDSIFAYSSNACMQFKIDLEKSSRGIMKFGEEGLQNISNSNIQRLRDIITNAGENNTHCFITGMINLQKNELIFSEMRIH